MRPRRRRPHAAGGLATVLGTAPVAPRYWLLFLGVALALVAVMELHKVSWRLRR